MQQGRSKALSKKEQAVRDKTPWRPQLDVETLYKKFMDFTTTSTAATDDMLKEMGLKALPPNKPSKVEPLKAKVIDAEEK